MSDCFIVRHSLLNSTIGKMTKSYWIAQELVKKLLHGYVDGLEGLCVIV